MLAELGLTGSPGRFTYNGNEYDDEYGFDLYYYGARYMDPALGRFTTPDPVRDFINPYSYVRNNPINAVDPSGMAGSGFEYTNCTGYEFRHRGNPFWWVDSGVYLRWKFATMSSMDREAMLNAYLKDNYREEITQVFNLLNQLKGEINDLIGDFVGPTIWHGFLTQISELLDSYDPEDNVFGSIHFVDNLMAISPDGEEEPAFATINMKTADIVVNSILLGGVYSDQWIKSIFVHEIAHVFSPGTFSYTQTWAWEYQMRYWDEFRPDMTHNLIENEWEQLHEEWLECGPDCDIFDFWGL
jgi:RHS repeat-associated protein